MTSERLVYSQRCHFVFETEAGTHWSPCRMEYGHEGRHQDGYGANRDPEKRWYKRTNYEELFDELTERVRAAGRHDLLEGLRL